MRARKASTFAAVVLVSPTRAVGRHVGRTEMLSCRAIGRLDVGRLSVAIEIDGFVGFVCRGDVDENGKENGRFETPLHVVRSRDTLWELTSRVKQDYPGVFVLLRTVPVGEDGAVLTCVKGAQINARTSS